MEKRNVLRNLKLAGENCERLMDRKVRKVVVQDVEIDEASTFVGKKERRKTREEKDRTDIGAGIHDRVDYAQQIKLYGAMPGGRDYHRPTKIKGTITSALNGRPKPGRVRASHIERKNGTLRQWCKRMTRLT